MRKQENNVIRTSGASLNKKKKMRPIRQRLQEKKLQPQGHEGEISWSRNSNRKSI